MESALLKVTPDMKKVLEVTFSHLDAKDSYAIDLQEGSNDVWKVAYMCDGTLSELVGKVVKIAEYSQTGPQRKLSPGVVDLVLKVRSGYKVTFDTSDDFKAGSVTVDVANLRSVKKLEYVPVPDPGQDKRKAIIVPVEAFNFMQHAYPEYYATMEEVPNRLITDKTVNASSMFNGCNALIKAPEMNTRNMTAMSAMFYDCFSLEELPAMETYKVTTMAGMFENCYKLSSIPAFDTRAVRTFSQMFKDCAALISLPELNMTSAVYTDGMFQGCSALEDVSFTKGTLRVDMDFSDCRLRKDVILNIIKNLGKPLGNKARTIVFDNLPADQVNNVEDYKYVFTTEEYNKYIQPALEAGWIFAGITWDNPAIPELRTDFTRYMSETYPLTYRDMTFVKLPNTSAGTTMQDMFAGCLSLLNVPSELVTPECLNMSGMFSNCIRIASLPFMNTSKVVNMTNMCYGCNELVAVPKLDTKKVTSFKGAFGNCLKLNTVAELDFTSCVDAEGMFNRCPNLEQFNIKYGTLHCSLDVSNTKLNKQSILNILDSVGEINFGNELNFIGVPEASNLTKEEYDQHVKPVLDSGWVIKGIKVPVESLLTNFSYYMKNHYPTDYMSMIQAPELPNTSEAEYAVGMYEGCEMMLANNQLYMPKLKDASRMFYGCTSMLNVYDMRASKELLNVDSMFYACVRMLTSPALSTSKVLDFSNMFNSCQMLTEIAELDLSSAKTLEGIVDHCPVLKIFNIKPGTLHISIDLSDTDLTKENLLNIIFNAGDPATNSETITFHGVKSQYDFTEEEMLTYIKPAIDKGWNIECDIDIPLLRTDFSWYMRNTYPEMYMGFETAPEVDISNAKFTDHMYEGCTELVTIPNELDMSNVVHAYGMFKGCSKLKNVSFKEGSIHCHINFSYTAIEKETVLKIFKALGTPIDDTVAIVFSNNIYDLTPEEYANYVTPAIQMGWKVYGIYEPIARITDFTDYMKTNHTDYETVEYITKLPDTSHGVNMTRMFANCPQLKMITANIDTSSCTNMNAMYQNCPSLSTVPAMNTDNVVDMSYMFDGCASLVYIPTELNFNGIVEDTSKDMFRHCYKLQLVAITPNSLTCDLDLSDTALDVSCVLNILKGLPQLTSKASKTIKFNNIYTFDEDKYNYVEQAQIKGWTVAGISKAAVEAPITDFTNYMKLTYPNDFFSIEECPVIDTSCAAIMQSMFEGCLALKNVVPLNMKNVFNTISMFAGCHSLESTPELDMSSVSDATLMFANCSSLVDLRIKAGTLTTNLDLSDCLNLSTESIYNLVDNLKALEGGSLSIIFPSKVISFEDYNNHIVPAMNKGWKISGVARELRTNFNDYMRLYYPESYQVLRTINNLEPTSEALTMNAMFKGCAKLVVAPAMQTSKVYDMTEMFDGCSNLTSVQSLSMINVKHTRRMFAGCVNLKMLSFTPGSLSVSLDLTDCPLTRQVVLSLIKNLSTTPSVGSVINFLTTQVTANEWQEYIAPAQENGWSFNGLTVAAVNPGEEIQEPMYPIYAADIIQDPDHQFVTEAERESIAESDSATSKVIAEIQAKNTEQDEALAELKAKDTSIEETVTANKEAFDTAISQATQAYNDLNTRVSTNETDIESLKAKDATIDTAIEQATQAYNNLVAKDTELEEAINTNKQVFDTAIEQATQAYSNLDTRVSANETNIESLQTKATELEEAQNANKVQIDDHENRLGTLEGEFEVVKNDVSEAETKIDDYETRISAAEAKVQVVQDKTATLEASDTELKDSVSQLRSAYEAHKDLTNIKLDDHEARIAAAEADIDALQSKDEELVAKDTELETAITSNKEAFDTAIQQAAAAYTGLDTRVKATEESLSSVKESVDSVSATQEATTSKLEDHETRLATTETAVEDLKAKDEEILEQNKELVNAYTADKANLLETFANYSTTTDAKITALQAKDEELEKAIESTGEGIETDIEALKAKDIELVAKDEELAKVQASDKAGLAKAIEENKADVDAKVEDLQTKHDKLVEDINEVNTMFTDEISSLKAKDEELVAKDSEIETNLEALKSGYEAHRDLSNIQLADHEKRIGKVETSVDEMESKFGTAIDQAAAAYTGLDTRLTTAESEIDELQTKGSETGTAVSELETKFNEAVSQATAAYSGLDERIKTNEADIDALQTQTTELDETVSELKSDYESNKSMASAQLANHESRILATETEIDDLQIRAADAKVKVEELETSVADLKANKDTANAKLEDHETRLATAESEIDELQAKTTELETTHNEDKVQMLETFNAHVETADAKFTALQTKDDEIEESIAALESKDEELTAKDAEIETNLSELKAQYESHRDMSNIQLMDHENRIKEAENTIQAHTEIANIQLKDHEERLGKVETSFEAHQELSNVQLADHEARLGTAESDIDALQAKTEELAAGASGSGESITKLTEDIKALQTKDTELETSVSEVETKLSESLSQAANAYSAIDTRIRANESKITAVEETVSTNKEAVEAATADIEALKAKDVELAAKDSEIESNLSELKAQYESHRDLSNIQLNDHETRIKEAENTIQAHTEIANIQLKDHEERLAAAEADIDTLQTGTEELKAAYESHRDLANIQLADHEARLGTAESEIDALQAKDTELETSATELKKAVDTLKADYETNKTTTEVKLTGQETRLTSAELNITELQNRDIATNSAVSDLKASFESHRETSNLQIANHEARIATNESDIVDLKLAVGTSEDAIEALNAVKEYNTRLTNAEVNLDEIEATLDKHEEEFAKHREEAIKQAIEQDDIVDSLTPMYLPSVDAEVPTEETVLKEFDMNKPFITEQDFVPYKVGVLKVEFKGTVPANGKSAYSLESEDAIWAAESFENSEAETAVDKVVYVKVTPGKLYNLSYKAKGDQITGTAKITYSTEINNQTTTVEDL